MGSHRKPRAVVPMPPAVRKGAVGLGAAVLASATLLSHSAAADDEDTPSIEEQRERADSARERALEIRERVDELYREAGTATQHYNEAQEETDEQRALAEALMDQAAEASAELNEARRDLGSLAAAQYRSGAGGLPDAAALLLAEDPRSFFATDHTLDRASQAQERAVAAFTERQREAAADRAGATEALAELESRQQELEAQKATVQEKLADARRLLDQLTEEEEAELAELERLEREEAERRAEQARREREEREERERREREAREAAEAEEAAQEAAEAEPDQEAEAPPAADADAAVSSQAEQAIAFAEAQIGKPYVWGATGPNSFDCSGLTQAAWRAAGVELPRVTWDQVNAGTTIAYDQMRPGDLVFFYDDISHVGLYIGDGMMIHAPKPGDVVKVESIDYMPFHSAVRPV